MEELDTSTYPIRIDKGYECKYCKKVTGTRSFQEITKTSVIFYLLSFIMYPFLSCCICCCLPYQHRRVFCLNCNAELVPEELI